eukprot:TRINITY_DN21923_c0_g1_i1.p1 TRINITY_DN21923_c0_g1~~TRINITY_DN21923_c0_g1_i1.p1  ORF type:complete len:930 (-),score=126.08 TRINITY_DN21923_c0_g1_i1:107-2785(-)
MQSFGGQQGVRASPFGAPTTSPFGTAAAPPPRSFPAAPPPPTSAFGGVAPPQTGSGGYGGVAPPGPAPPPTADQLRASPAPVASSAPPGPFSAGATAAATPGGFPAVQPAAAFGGFPIDAKAPDPHQANMAKDIEMFNSPVTYVRSTIGRFPNTVSAKQKTCVPIGITLQPLAPTPPGGKDASTVNLSSSVGTIVRCRSCRTYINPFVGWESNGRRWTCNLCGFSQLTPDPYYCGLDETGKRTDRFSRPELCEGSVEYIATGEYMVRPPQPPVFMFVIDVSYVSCSTGMLDTVLSAIKDVIQGQQLPGGSRTQVGIITYDTSVHFYNLSANLSQPQMLVVSDLADLFLPIPGDILVNVSDSESAIMNLLESLPEMFRETNINESCMGSAVKAAFMAMKHVGGKMLVFGSCIPSVGALALKSTRENSRTQNDRDVELLRPVDDGFKDLATELTKAQISVAMFMAPQQYVDLASLAPLAKFTGGDLRYYPGFHIHTQGLKLKTELLHVLTRYMGWEAVMRVRVSRGWKITNFYGHFYKRGVDLLVVPNCHADQTFAITVDMEENVTPDPVLCVQSALLYTNSNGERRIRVNTWAGLTTQNHSEIINSIDVQATISLLTLQAFETSLAVNLPEGRNKLQTQCQQIVQTGNAFPNAEALQFLPLYILGMLKSAAFRATKDVSADMRTSIWVRLGTLSVSQLAAYFYPRLMALHNMQDNVGTLDESNFTVMPQLLNLTSESLTQDGVFIVEDGDVMIVWIGREANPAFLQSVFGVNSFDELDPTAAEMGTLGDPLSIRIASILAQVRSERPVPHISLIVVKQGEQGVKEPRFFMSLIEDRTQALQSTYTEFLQLMGYRPQQQSAAPPAPASAAPPMGAAMTNPMDGPPPLSSPALRR